MKSIAILLTVFNRKEKTLNCLSKIYSQNQINGYTFDIYLTNDACTDGTPEAINQQYPEVNIINGKGDLFWNRGMYTAWKRASEVKDYDFYLWLNDDTFVYPNMLENLLAASENKNNKAIIIGATQSSDHKLITYGGRLKNGNIPQPKGELTQVAYFNGNIVLVLTY